MTEFFFSKDREKAFDELKQALYNRLQQRRNYAEQNPLKDVYFKGLQKGALSEVDFLEKLLDLIERS
jgi:coproporphyrinogen III oxidase-like Fe-S oxidoreductase